MLCAGVYFGVGKCEGFFIFHVWKISYSYFKTEENESTENGLRIGKPHVSSFS